MYSVCVGPEGGGYKLFFRKFTLYILFLVKAWNIKMLKYDPPPLPPATTNTN